MASDVAVRLLQSSLAVFAQMDGNAQYEIDVQQSNEWQNWSTGARILYMKGKKVPARGTHQRHWGERFDSTKETYL